MLHHQSTDSQGAAGRIELVGILRRETSFVQSYTTIDIVQGWAKIES